MSGPTPARAVAYEVLRRVFEHGAYADRALRSAAGRAGLEGRERGFAQRLAYGSVQRRGSSDHLIVELTSRPTERIEPALLAALRLGMFELLFDDAVADHAAVDQAVELAKGGRDGGRRHRGAGLVNAVLRRASREGRELLATVGTADPAAAAITHSVPQWIAELWWEEQGQERALELMAAANRPPVRCYRITPVGREADVEQALVVAGVRLEQPTLGDSLLKGVGLLQVADGDWNLLEDAVHRGELVPQSPGSAAAANLLGVQPGDRVLDLCAAPGIKTTQLAEAARPEGRVTAVELDPARASELEELCGRAGLSNVSVLRGDGAELELRSGYDRVLVDAPCSGLGTLASRPDVRWRRTAEEVGATAALQRRLLGNAASALEPGGRLLYSVCTISRREGSAVAAGQAGSDSGLTALDLGGEHPDLAATDDRRFLQLLPGRDGSDGFFISGFERAAEGSA